jgi:hypothetical protein
MLLTINFHIIHFSLFLWKLQAVGGIDFVIDPETGKGRLTLWRKVKEKHVDEEIDHELKQSSFLNCCIGQHHEHTSSECTHYTDYETNPQGLLFFEAFTPVHDPIRKQQLSSSWAGALLILLKSPFSVPAWKMLHQPIEDIKDYFGVKIALYFLFVGHLLQWLSVPSLVGVIIVIVDWTVDKKNIGTYDSNLSGPYTFFIIIWAIFFLEYWKRKQFHFSVLWGTSDYETKATFRKEWLNMYEALEGTDDPCEVDLIKASRYESLKILRGPNYWGLGISCKKYFSLTALVFSISVVVISVISVILFMAFEISIGNTCKIFAFSS